MCLNEGCIDRVDLQLDRKNNITSRKSLTIGQSKSSGFTMCYLKSNTSLVTIMVICLLIYLSVHVYVRVSICVYIFSNIINYTVQLD